MFNIKKLPFFPGLDNTRPIRLTITYPTDNILRDSVYPVRSRDGIKELEVYLSCDELMELSKSLKEAGF